MNTRPGYKTLIKNLSNREAKIIMIALSELTSCKKEEIDSFLEKVDQSLSLLKADHLPTQEQ